jgi:hypothetical protein
LVCNTQSVEEVHVLNFALFPFSSPFAWIMQSKVAGTDLLVWNHYLSRETVWNFSQPSEIERDFIWIHSRVDSCSTNGCEIQDYITMENFLNIEWTERMVAHTVVGLETRHSWIGIFWDLVQFEMLRPF